MNDDDGLLFVMDYKANGDDSVYSFKVRKWRQPIMYKKVPDVNDACDCWIMIDCWLILMPEIVG